TEIYTPALHDALPILRRVIKKAFQIAKDRRKKLTSVDKSNVLEVSALWREVVEEERKNYPDVEVEHLYVDNCAMQIVKRPTSFRSEEHTSELQSRENL